MSESATLHRDTLGIVWVKTNNKVSVRGAACILSRDIGIQAAKVCVVVRRLNARKVLFEYGPAHGRLGETLVRSNDPWRGG